MKVHVYIEGGGEKTADIRLREGFRGLIERDMASGPARNLRIIAGGNTNRTYRDFCIGVRSARESNLCFAILVDSDTPVAAVARGWDVLANMANCGARPASSHPESAHLMVEVMESWIVADLGNLERFYGDGFSAKPLGFGNNIENVPKADIYAGLKSATRRSGKGEYHKTLHGFDLIESTDPAMLRTRSPHAAAFLDFIIGQLRE